MSMSPSPFKLGLFVIGGVTLVVIALLALGLRRRLEARVELETYATDAGRLHVGSAVKLDGVNVGEVTALEFSWNEYPGGDPACVVVHFDVRARALPRSPELFLEQAVHRGLRAIVDTEGITGVAVLSLSSVDPAENPPLHVSWTPRHPVVPSAPNQLDQIIRSVRTTLASVQRIDFARLGARVDDLLDAANATLHQLDGLDVKRLSGDLHATARRISAASDELGALARETRAAVRGAQLDALGRDASALVASLRDSNARLQLLIERLSDVDGRDLHETVAGVHEAVVGLNEVITKLQGYPSGFLFGEKPPPARSVERSR
jgi:ABC-type transporter Mla subunit MlaD